MQAALARSVQAAGPVHHGPNLAHCVPRLQPCRAHRTHRRASVRAEAANGQREAFTISQMYVSEQDRPKPIPLSEHEERSRRRLVLELAEAGKRKGVTADVIQRRLLELDTVLPGLVNLHRAKASDWVTIISDIPLLTAKVIILKDCFPHANVLRILSDQPRLLLRENEDLRADAEKVKAMLSRVEGAEALLDSIPSLINPFNLERSLVVVRTLFPGEVPLVMLMKHPDILNNLGESSIEDSAEYGELSTKD